MLVLLAGCCCPPPAPDFSTPRQTISTFCQALDGRDSVTLYRCLSEPLKQCYDLDVQKVDLALDILLDRNPEIAWAADGEITRADPIPARDGFWRVEVEFSFLWISHRIEFVLVRGCVAEIRIAGEDSPSSWYLRPSRVISRPPMTTDFLHVVDPDEGDLVRLEITNEELATLILEGSSAITSIRVSDVWKIYQISDPEDEIQSGLRRTSRSPAQGVAESTPSPIRTP